MNRTDSNYSTGDDNHDNDDDKGDNDEDDGAPCNKCYCCLNLWV